MVTTAKRVTLVTLLACTLLLPGAVFAGGFNLAGVGAKALSMSGSFRAVSDDWSAMYWNPAGLAGQPTQLAIEGKLLYPMAWVTPNAPPTTTAYEGYRLYTNGVEQSSRAKAFPDGAAAFVYRFNEDMSAGLSVFAPSALGATWEDFYRGPYYGYDEDPEYPSRAWFSDMVIVDVHPTIAYRINDKLKAGVGLSVIYAMLDIQSPKLAPSNDGTGTRLPLPNQHFFIDTYLEGSGVGFGFNAGLLYDLTDKFHIGLSYHGPATVPIEGTVRQTLYMPAITQEPNGEVEPDATADFPLPMDAGIGLAYDFSRRLTVAADVVWTNWEALDEVEIILEGTGLDDQPAENSALVLHWENTIRYNFGLNYVAIPERGLEFRAGYYMDPTPIPEATLRPTITDVADKHNISLGFACNLATKLKLEGYWEHVFTGTRTVEPTLDDNGNWDLENVPGDWKMQVDTFGMQLTYTF